jgi:hypothetical protein
VTVQELSSRKGRQHLVRQSNPLRFTPGQQQERRAEPESLAEMVTGHAPVSGLDQLISDWRGGGGDQMRAEFQQAYSDSKK